MIKHAQPLLLLNSKDMKLSATILIMHDLLRKYKMQPMFDKLGGI